MKDILFVVEGKHDVDKVKKIYPTADCMITNGTHLTDETIALIKKLESSKQIVLLLDPDYPGEKIRKKLSEVLTDVMHIYVNKKIAISKNHRKVGIEHISVSELKNILEEQIVFTKKSTTQMTLFELYELGLVGQQRSKEYRIKAGEHFRIGYGNAKEFLRRINLYSIPYDELSKIVEVIK
jgi:ribonuclease M5